MSESLIGAKATIVGFSLVGKSLGEDSLTAYVCLDLEDGRRVFFEAYDPDVELRYGEIEPQPHSK